MKLETAIVFTKGACYALDGFCAPVVVGLAAWFNTGDWPPRIVWVVMGFMAVKGAATSLSAFLSGSFSDYITKRSAGNTQFINKPT